MSPPILHGIDILEDRILKARKSFPGINFTAGDAGNTAYPGSSFDMVFENSVLIQTTDDKASEKIAREMLRVVKPGGHILLIDWRYSNPSIQTTRG